MEYTLLQSHNTLTVGEIECVTVVDRVISCYRVIIHILSVSEIEHMKCFRVILHTNGE